MNELKRLIIMKVGTNKCCQLQFVLFILQPAVTEYLFPEWADRAARKADTAPDGRQIPLRGGVEVAVGGGDYELNCFPPKVHMLKP